MTDARKEPAPELAGLVGSLDSKADEFEYPEGRESTPEWKAARAIEALSARNAEQAEEIEQQNAWIEDLQGGMFVNCVYCGHRYGPGETTPVSMAYALKAHIEQCPKHPMSALKAEAEIFAASNAALTSEVLAIRATQADLLAALRDTTRVLEGLQFAGPRFKCMECGGQPVTGHLGNCRVEKAIAQGALKRVEEGTP